MSICDHNLKVLDNHFSEDVVDTLIQQLLYIYFKKGLSLAILLY